MLLYFPHTLGSIDNLCCTQLVLCMPRRTCSCTSGFASQLLRSIAVATSVARVLPCYYRQGRRGLHGASCVEVVRFSVWWYIALNIRMRDDAQMPLRRVYPRVPCRPVRHHHLWASASLTFYVYVCTLMSCYAAQSSP